MELKGATARSSVKRVLKKAAEPMLDLVDDYAPKRTGLLKRSFVIASRSSARERKKSDLEVYVGPEGGPGGINYAIHQEFGNSVHAAHPFMRPAWDATKYTALEVFKTEIWKDVTKTVEHARRRKS